MNTYRIMTIIIYNRVSKILYIYKYLYFVNLLLTYNIFNISHIIWVPQSLHNTSYIIGKRSSSSKSSSNVFDRSPLAILCPFRDLSIQRCYPAIKSSVDLLLFSRPRFLTESFWPWCSIS